MAFCIQKNQIQKPLEVICMPKQYPIPIPDGQALPYDAADIAQSIGIELGTFLFPFLGKLDDILDKRLVRTFLSTIQVIMTIRSRVHGLLLWEMGALLLDPEHERAGTKRLANLLHSPRWSAQMSEQFRLPASHCLCPRDGASWTASLCSLG